MNEMHARMNERQVSVNFKFWLFFIFSGAKAGKGFLGNGKGGWEMYRKGGCVQTYADKEKL